MLTGTGITVYFFVLFYGSHTGIGQGLPFTFKGSSGNPNGTRHYLSSFMRGSGWDAAMENYQWFLLGMIVA